MKSPLRRLTAVYLNTLLFLASCDQVSCDKSSHPQYKKDILLVLNIKERLSVRREPLYVPRLKLTVLGSRRKQTRADPEQP